jgi:hypothetical protein
MNFFNNNQKFSHETDEEHQQRLYRQSQLYSTIGFPRSPSDEQTEIPNNTTTLTTTATTATTANTTATTAITATTTATQMTENYIRAPNSPYSNTNVEPTGSEPLTNPNPSQNEPTTSTTNPSISAKTVFV